MERLSADPKFIDIEENIKVIRERIAVAASGSGRDSGDVRFMAVTKTVQPVYINHAIDCGINLIGENRVQEYLEKAPELNLEGVEFHLIGHLQTNKVKKIIGKAAVIQSVDSLNLANEISKHAKNAGITQDILVEINAGSEYSKFGFEPGEVKEKVLEIGEIDAVRVKGLMCVAPICDEKRELIKIFQNMYNIFIDIKAKKSDNICMDILSMGMSGDYEEAILCGANLVRVGSAVFGPRIYTDRH